MSWFHWLQVLLWAGSVAWAARLLHGLLFVAHVDTVRLRRGLSEHLERAQEVESLLEAAQPSWVGRVGLAQIRHGEADADALLMDLRAHAVRRLASLMTLGRIAPPLAFLGAVLELTAAFGGRGHGLLALQKGLPEQIALGRATTGVCIGALSAAFCFSVARQLVSHVRQMERDVRRLRADLEAAGV